MRHSPSDPNPGRFRGFTTARPFPPVTLGIRNIYILPTGYGLFFLFALVGMLIGSINYNNNLGFLLTFLLGSLTLVGMAHTYSALLGLRIVEITAAPVFAGEYMTLNIHLAPVTRARMGLRWRAEKGTPALSDIFPDTRLPIPVKIRTTVRGELTLPLLSLSCTYPLGLFRAWTRINPGISVLVYPRPVSGPAPMSGGRTPAEKGKRAAGASGADDFQGIRTYQAGDPLQRLYWRAYSRGRGLHTKIFSDPASDAMMLDMGRLQGTDTEKKLSILCFHVLRAQKMRQRFGLILGSRTVPPGIGMPHRQRCLRELSLYGKR